ncbi:MAG: hypothetical protein AAFQ76_15820 [Cyanobacteria bacterium J06626_26]
MRKFLIGVAIATSAGIHGLTLMTSGLIWAVIYLSIAQVEYTRLADPAGEYEAIVTYSKIHHFMPGMPGQGSDRPGTISVYDRKGNFYGSGSLNFIRDGYEIEWTENGASLPFVGEWDFEAGTYSYWSDNSQELIVEQIRE